jgi:hypothetical protein
MDSKMKLSKQEKERLNRYIDSRVSILEGFVEFDSSVTDAADTLREKLTSAKEKISNTPEKE